MIKYQFVSTQIDVFNRVAQCTLVRRLTFEFVLMFDDEANTDSMTEFNVMQQNEGEAPKTTTMKDTASYISFDAMAQLGLKQLCNSFVWLIGEVLV